MQISVSAYRTLERGTVRMKIRLWTALADRYGVTLDDLMGRSRHA